MRRHDGTFGPEDTARRHPPAPSIDSYHAGRRLLDDAGKTLRKLPGKIAHQLLSFHGGQDKRRRGGSTSPGWLGWGLEVWGGWVGGPVRSGVSRLSGPFRHLTALYLR